jgi:hypothetical protein
MKFTVFILTRRKTDPLGTERIDPVCSTDFNELSTVIKDEYAATKCKENYLTHRGTHCTDREASIIVRDCEYDWFISEKEIEVTFKVLEKAFLEGEEY